MREGEEIREKNIREEELPQVPQSIAIKTYLFNQIPSCLRSLSKFVTTEDFSRKMLP